jgi:hypothetical protein
MKIILFFSALFFNACSIRSVYLEDGIESHVRIARMDSVSHSIFLIGDAGDPMPDSTERILAVLTDAVMQRSRNSTVIFLGDNIYPAGLPKPDHSERSEMERRLDEQIAVGERSGVATYFVPGNHDWDRQGRDGMSAIRRQERFIAGKGLSHVQMHPVDALPGPSFIDVNDDIRIIFIDTQWWLHEYEKPLYRHTTTEEGTKKAFLDSLSQLLRTSRKTIVAGHHPLETYGEHGGFFDWRDHFFPLRHLSTYLWIPLPGIGSLYPLSRMWGITQQDFSGSKYGELRQRLDSVLSTHPPVAYASGHDHTLQILKPTNGYHYLVSGFGMKNHSSALTSGDRTIFARRAPGFMRLDFMINGRISVRVFEVSESSDGEEIFSTMLR